MPIYFWPAYFSSLCRPNDQYIPMLYTQHMLFPMMIPGRFFLDVFFCEYEFGQLNEINCRRRSRVHTKDEAEN